MKKLLLSLLLVSALSSHAFGFATIVTTIKGGDEMRFTTNVEGASIYLDNLMIGKTSAGTFTYKLKRTGAPRTFVFKKEGYQDSVITVNTQFDQMFWGNVLFGGTLGSSTDSWFTENDKEYSPNQFFVELQKSNK
jgi:hypothetical protein